MIPAIRNFEGEHSLFLFYFTSKNTVLTREEARGTIVLGAILVANICKIEFHHTVE